MTPRPSYSKHKVSLPILGWGEAAEFGIAECHVVKDSQLWLALTWLGTVYALNSQFRHFAWHKCTGSSHIASIGTLETAETERILVRIILLIKEPQILYNEVVIERLGQAIRAQGQAAEMELHGSSLTTPGILPSTSWKNGKKGFCLEAQNRRQFLARFVWKSLYSSTTRRSKVPFLFPLFRCPYRCDENTTILNKELLVFAHFTFSCFLLEQCSAEWLQSSSSGKSLLGYAQ
jgi:hypothetical protein